MLSHLRRRSRGRNGSSGWTGRLLAFSSTHILGIPVNKEADYRFRADQATHLAIFEPFANQCSAKPSLGKLLR